MSSVAADTPLTFPGQTSYSPAIGSNSRSSSIPIGLNYGNASTAPRNDPALGRPFFVKGAINNNVNNFNGNAVTGDVFRPLRVPDFPALPQPSASMLSLDALKF